MSTLFKHFLEVVWSVDFLGHITVVNLNFGYTLLILVDHSVLTYTMGIDQMKDSGHSF